VREPAINLHAGGFASSRSRVTSSAEGRHRGSEHVVTPTPEREKAVAISESTSRKPKTRRRENVAMIDDMKPSAG